MWCQICEYLEIINDLGLMLVSATLLLSHSPNQSLNQGRLEAYIARSTEPMLDFSDRFETSSMLSGEYNPKASHTNGTNTPRDLHSRLKIVELYTLHVLPRNEEWDYAREFIQINELLDDERKDLFLQTLQSLQDQKHEDGERDDELQRERDAALDQSRREHQLQQEEATRTAEDIRKHEYTQSSSEIDYGIEDSVPKSLIKKSAEKKWTAVNPNESTTKLHAGGKQPTRRPPDSLRTRGSAVINSLQKIMLVTAESLSKNPNILLRTLLFIIALLIALGRRDMRLWLTRISTIGWDRVKRTVGMGVKVSYI